VCSCSSRGGWSRSRPPAGSSATADTVSGCLRRRPLTPCKSPLLGVGRSAFPPDNSVNGEAAHSSPRAPRYRFRHGPVSPPGRGRSAERARANPSIGVGRAVLRPPTVRNAETVPVSREPQPSDAGSSPEPDTFPASPDGPQDPLRGPSASMSLRRGTGGKAAVKPAGHGAGATPGQASFFMSGPAREAMRCPACRSRYCGYASSFRNASSVSPIALATTTPAPMAAPITILRMTLYH
jgi:hypothetical protein